MLEYEIKSKSALQKRSDPRGTIRDLPFSINPYHVPLFFVFSFFYFLLSVDLVAKAIALRLVHFL